MSGSDPAPARARLRREPPHFRRVTVRRVERLTPRMVRVTLGGDELAGLVVEQPASSVRLLVPPPGTRELAMPHWNGNEFLLPDGGRPAIRTFTPRRLDNQRSELDLEIVVHGEGPVSGWAERATPDDAAAVSGTARGYEIDPEATGFLLAGDETAIPAIGQLLEVLPPDTPVEVHVEVARPEARLPLPEHPRAVVRWHELPEGAAPGDTLVGVIRGAELSPGDRVWAAGEAAGVQRIRRHLFEERGMPRSRASVRGYWKHGRSGDGGDD